MGEKCCCCFKLETGCVILGVTTFLFSLVMTAMALSCIMVEEYRHKEYMTSHVNLTAATRHHLNHVFGWHMDREVIEVSLGLVVVIGSMWMVFSALFIFGILKSKASHVMSYFLFGAAVCIIFLLSALLVVINGMWVLSLITSILTVIYARCLVAVYGAYEKMQGGALGDQQYLVSEEDFAVAD